MQTPPEGPGSFPFPAGDAPPPREGRSEPELKGEMEAKLKTDADVSTASTARRSILEQFIRNRPESRGAKILTILDRIRALFIAPSSPEGRARAQGNRHATRARSLFALFDAVTGGSPVTDQLRSDLGITSSNGTEAGAREPSSGLVPEGFSPDALARDMVPSDVLRQLSPEQVGRLEGLRNRVGALAFGSYGSICNSMALTGLDYKSHCNYLLTNPRGQSLLADSVRRAFPTATPAQLKVETELARKRTREAANLDPQDIAVFDAVARIIRSS